MLNIAYNNSKQHMINVYLPYRVLVRALSIDCRTKSEPKITPFKAKLLKLGYYTLAYRPRPNLPFLISDIRALWRSALSATVPECQKLNTVG